MAPGLIQKRIVDRLLILLLKECLAITEVSHQVKAVLAELPRALYFFQALQCPCFVRARCGRLLELQVDDGELVKTLQVLSRGGGQSVAALDRERKGRRLSDEAESLVPFPRPGGTPQIIPEPVLGFSTKPDSSRS